MPQDDLGISLLYYLFHKLFKTHYSVQIHAPILLKFGILIGSQKANIDIKFGTYLWGVINKFSHKTIEFLSRLKDKSLQRTSWCNFTEHALWQFKINGVRENTDMKNFVKTAKSILCNNKSKVSINIRHSAKKNMFKIAVKVD